MGKLSRLRDALSASSSGPTLAAASTSTRFFRVQILVTDDGPSMQYDRSRTPRGGDMAAVTSSRSVAYSVQRQQGYSSNSSTRLSVLGVVRNCSSLDNHQPRHGGRARLVHTPKIPLAPSSPGRPHVRSRSLELVFSVETRMECTAS